MAETMTISLGGQRFEIRALTFRQMRDIEEALARTAKTGPLTRIDFDAAVDILAAALRRGTTALDREAILDLEGSKAEFVAATRAVLELSGYIEKAAAPPGEAQAGN
ncbi:MAG TPA: hypothetical protein VIJ42_10685 [Stellaceae bacterium]